MRSSENTLLKALQIFGVWMVILSGCLFIPQMSSAESAGSNVLFILDGSGSMWGRLENVEKIVIVKKRMTELVQDWDDVNMGLIVYGHRTKGDCDDIEMLVPLGPGNQNAIVQQIQSINPKGKTPIQRSIMLAVQHLETLEDETEIVLVSDGLETCDDDPCGFVKSLKEKGIKFRLDVVGFDIKEEEREQLECLANAGGGRYFSAQNAIQLKEAFTEVKKEVTENVEVTSTLDKGLILHYPFNGNANDESGNRNHGKVYGATLTEDKAGNAESAYHFEAKNAIVSSRNVGVSGNRERTLAAWIKWEYLHPKDFVFIAGWGANSNNRRFAIVTEWARGQRPYLKCNDVDHNISIWLWGTQCGSELNSTIIPQLKEWYHVVGVYDGRSAKIYLNGRLNKTKTFSLRTGDSQFAIGSGTFSGTIDDVRVYNRALSDSEIQELYERGQGKTVHTETPKPENQEKVETQTQPEDQEKQTKVVKRKTTIKREIGTIKITNLKSREVYITKGDKWIEKLQPNNPVKEMPAGQYGLAFVDDGSLITHIDLTGGDTVEIVLGGISLPSLAGKEVQVIQKDSRYRAGRISSQTRFVEMGAGTYRLAFGNYYIPVTVEAGKTTELLLGAIRIPNLTDQAEVVTQKGDVYLGPILPNVGVMEVPPGTYKVRISG